MPVNDSVCSILPCAQCLHGDYVARPMRICNDCLLLQSFGMARECAMFRVALCNMLFVKVRRLGLSPLSMVVLYHRRTMVSITKVLNICYVFVTITGSSQNVHNMRKNE